MVPLRSHLARARVIGALIALCALSFGRLAARPPEADAVLDGWFAAQRAIRGWSADFTQIRALRALSRPLTTPGRLWFAPPDRFRWELGRPARTLAIRRGDTLWLVYPRLKRIEQYPLDGDPRSPWRSAMALIEAGFPRDRESFEQRFRVEAVTRTNGVYRVRFQPRAAAPRQFLAGLSVELRTNDFALRANTMTFVDGSTLRNEYTRAVVNPPLDDALFTVRTNAGWEVAGPETP